MISCKNWYAGEFTFTFISRIFVKHERIAVIFLFGSLSLLMCKILLYFYRQFFGVAGEDPLLFLPFGFFFSD
jgi:hypothetical protein